MTRIMRDSTTITDIPVGGTQVVLAYVNGRFAASPAAVALRFPGVPVAWVDVTGADPAADVLDVETGDATPAAAASWAVAKLKAAHPYLPVIYCNRGNVTAVFNAMSAAGLQVARDFRTIIATLDGTQRIADMTGVTAVQYAGQAQTGGHYDQSIVYDDTWKAPAAPPPAPAVSLAAARSALSNIAASQLILSDYLGHLGS